MQSGAFNDNGTRALGGPIPGSTTMQQSPDDYLQEALKSEMNAIQLKLNERWKMIQKQKDYLGPEKTNAMLVQLEMAARNKVIELKAGVQQRVDMMSRIRNLQKQGALNNAADFTQNGSVDKMLWTVAAGADIADSMFPQEKPPEQVGTPKEYATLQQHEAGIQKDIERFRILPGEYVKPHWYSKKKFVSPRLQVLDPTATTKVETKNGWVTETGAWVDAPRPIEDAKELGSQIGELNLVRTAMSSFRAGEPIGISGLGKLRNASRGLITGQNKMGTLRDKVNASVLAKEFDKGQSKQKESARPNVRVKHLASGQTGWLPADEFDPSQYERLQ